MTGSIEQGATTAMSSISGQFRRTRKDSEPESMTMEPVANKKDNGI